MRKVMILGLITALVVALVAGTATATPDKGNNGKGSSDKGKSHDGTTVAADHAKAAPGKGSGNSGKGNNGKGQGPAAVTYEFKGTVTEVKQATPADPETGTQASPASITVDVTGGNNATKQLRGSQTFSVNESGGKDATKIEVDDQEGTSFDQIQKGYKVNVQAKAPAGTTSGFVARVVSAESPEADDSSGQDNS